jgi:hypothetical protein
MEAIRSRKVRRVLRLEAQAAKLQTRGDKAQARADLFGRRREACLTEARAIEGSLTGAQRGELERVRSAAS